jgi:hypothetical protein
MSAVLRAKVVVTSVKRSVNVDGNYSNEEIELSAVSGNSEENKQWSKWTPSAQFKLQINNEAAFGKLPVGTQFFIDFTPASSDTTEPKS